MLGSWILRNKAIYPPIPSFALVILPLIFAGTVLIALVFTFILSFILKVESGSGILLLFLLGFVLTSYLLRAKYIQVFYSIFLFLIKRNGKNQFEKILIRTLKYCVLTYIYVPLILLIQVVFPNQLQQTFIWAAIPFIYFYASILLTVLAAVLVEYLTPEKLFIEVEKIYNSPK